MSVDHSAIEVFENFLGVSLPTQYAKFLQENDGEPPKKGRFEIPGEDDDLTQYFFL